jgi:hypothetical protein
LIRIGWEYWDTKFKLRGLAVVDALRASIFFIKVSTGVIANYVTHMSFRQVWTLFFFYLTANYVTHMSFRQVWTLFFFNLTANYVTHMSFRQVWTLFF